MSEQRFYAWHYAKLKYQFAESVGVHGSFGVDVHAQVDRGKLWVRLMITSQSGNFGLLIPSGRVRLIVDGIVTGDSQPSERTRQERTDPRPKLKAGGPFDSRFELPDPTRVTMTLDAFEIPELWETIMVPAEQIMTPAEQRLSTDVEYTKRMRQRILEVLVNIQVTMPDGSGTVPSVPPSLTPQYYNLE